MRTYRRADGASFVGKIDERTRKEQAAERRRMRESRGTGQHTTMPIKDMDMVRRWLDIARDHDAHMREGGVSWYLLLLLGFNTAFRVGDLCRLRVRDVRGRAYIRMAAQKTGKISEVALTQEAQRRISAALAGRDPENWALLSRQRDGSGDARPVSRQRCYAIVREIARRAGFKEHTGCHTLRKTFAWQYYKACGDLAELQDMLRHSSQAATIRYLGLDREQHRETINKMPRMV